MTSAGCFRSAQTGRSQSLRRHNRYDPDSIRNLWRFCPAELRAWRHNKAIDLGCAEGPSVVGTEALWDVDNEILANLSTYISNCVERLHGAFHSKRRRGAGDARRRSFERGGFTVVYGCWKRVEKCAILCHNSGHGTVANG